MEVEDEEMQDDSEEDTIDVSMDVIKVDGKWYISYGSIDVG